MVFLTTIIIWLLETGKYWFVMHAFPFQASFFTLMLMNGIVNLATTLPSAPGYVGTFDGRRDRRLDRLTAPHRPSPPDIPWCCTLALWLPITIVGAVYFLREGLKWGQKYDVELEGQNA